MTIKLAQQNEEGNINHLIQKANAVLVSVRPSVTTDRQANMDFYLEHLRQ